MQMSVFLALVQTFVAAASLGVALLALERVDAPPGGGGIKKKEDKAPALPGRACGGPGPPGW